MARKKQERKTTSLGVTPKQYRVLKLLADTKMPALRPVEITKEAGAALGHRGADNAWATRKLEALMNLGLVGKRGRGLYHITKDGRAHVSTVERRMRERRQREREEQKGGGQ